jgi:hypothetical protein
MQEDRLKWRKEGAGARRRGEGGRRGEEGGGGGVVTVPAKQITTLLVS